MNKDRVAKKLGTVAMNPILLDKVMRIIEEEVEAIAVSYRAELDKLSISNYELRKQIPKVNVRQDWAGDGISSHRYLDVSNVEREDDGSFTAVVGDPN